MCAAIFLHQLADNESREQYSEEDNFLARESHGDKRAGRPLGIGAAHPKAHSDTDDLPPPEGAG